MYLSKERLVHWVVDIIILACQASVMTCHCNDMPLCEDNILIMGIS